jgi:TonB-dependent receptor
MKATSSCILTSALGLFLSFGLITSVFAQSNGRITGKVVESGSGEALFGANILIEGTTRGTTTDFEGAYTLASLEPGTYTIIFRYITYSTVTITGVVVKANEATVVNVMMESDTFGLSEITVTAEANRETAAALLSMQRRAIAFQDGISTEQISRTGAGNVAEAMSKVTGASVVGGKYVYVRGLGDRYTSTHLNGIELPSADPDKKAFQLDLIPSKLLDNVVTLKTFTPDKPGNFSGGLVDVATKQFPENYSISVSLSSSYNSISSFNKGLLPVQSSTDWLGYDDGMRALPSELRNSPVVPSHIEAQFDANQAAELDRLSRAFRPEMAPTSVNTPINRNFGISMGSQIQSPIGLFGYVLGGSYKQSTSSYNDGSIGIYKMVGSIDETAALTPINEMSDSKTSMDVDIGLLGSVSYKPNGSNRFTFNAMRTQSGSSTGRHIIGYWDEANEADFADSESRVLEYTQRSLQSYQLMGSHQLASLGNLSVDWNLSTADNKQEQPDLRFLENGVIDLPNGGQTYSLSNGLYARPSRFFRDLTEDNRTGTIDLTYPAHSKSGMFKIKTGLFYQAVNRDFTENRFDYYQGRSTQTFTDFDLDWNQYFGHVGVVDTTSRFVFGNYITDATSPKNSYDADSETRAAYLMFEVPLGALKVVAGARVEDVQINAISRDTILARGELDNTDWLPSLTAIYALNESMNLRVAYTHTVARPTFRELAPYATFDFYGSFVFTGNDTLTRTLIRNMDVRYEWYPNPGELIAVSGFYKNLTNPIERAIRPEVNKNMTVQNVRSGRVYGFEMEARKNLGFVHDILNSFSVATNFTYVNSYVDIPKNELFNIRINDPEAKSTRSLAGQSPYIVNFDLSYQNLSNGFSADLSINRFGDRLHAVSVGAAPDIYEKAITSVDVLVRKSFGRFELSGTAKNLLNPTVRYTQEFNGVYYDTQRFSLGRTFSLGISYGI